MTCNIFKPRVMSSNHVVLYLSVKRYIATKPRPSEAASWAWSYC